MSCRCPKDGDLLITAGEWECNLKFLLTIREKNWPAAYYLGE